MEYNDPFRRLSFECAGNILLYLDLRSLAHCEQVSRGWRDFVRAWIVSSGFRVNYPGLWQGKTAGDPTHAVKKFKELAAPYYNFTSGKATSVRRYEFDFRGFALAGDFAVWVAKREFFWQRLTVKEDGLLYPAQKLDLIIPYDYLGLLLVNDEGYMLVVSQMKGPWIRGPGRFSHQSTLTRVDVVSLESGEKLYSSDQSRLEPMGEILALGKERIYSTIEGGVYASLVAHDLKSGTRLYEVQTGEQRFSTQNRVGNMKSKPTLLQAGGREVLACFLHPSSNDLPTRAHIFFFNGEDGQLMQKIETSFWLDVYTMIAASREEFAVLSHEDHEGRNIKVQKFSQNANGGFYESCTEVVTVMGPAPDLKNIAIDPFRYFGLGLKKTRWLPVVWSLRETDSLSRQSGHKVMVLKGAGGLEAMVDRVWAGGEDQQEITLPPKYSHHKSRRLFIPTQDDSQFRISLGDGNRLLLHTHQSYYFDPQYAVYLFDFGLRVRKKS